MKKTKEFRKEIIDGEETFVGYYDLNQMSGEEIADDFLAQEKAHNNNKAFVSYDYRYDALSIFYKENKEGENISCYATETKGYENCYEVYLKDNNELVGYIFYGFFNDKKEEILENFPFVDRDFKRDILPEIIYYFEHYEAKEEA